MTTHPSVTPKRLISIIRSNERNLTNYGLCTHCGKRASNVEPDAECYICKHCAEPAVYGAEQLLLLSV